MKKDYLAGIVSAQYCFKDRDIQAAISHESRPVSLASLWERQGIRSLLPLTEFIRISSPVISDNAFRRN